MAIRRGRRRQTVVWLPNEANQTQVGEGVNFRSDALLIAGAINVITTTVYALTVDYPPEALQSLGPQPPTVADYIQGEYRLERVVGKFVVGLNQSIGMVGATFPVSCIVGMGLIVLRVDEQTGAPLRAATPIQYSTLVDNNERDPFIFRRTWALANDLGTPTATADQGLAQAPRCNADYGSGPEGTFVDTQTRRIVGPEQRLFLVVDTVNIGQTAESNGGAFFYFDYRILVTPRRASNRNNASR